MNIAAASIGTIIFTKMLGAERGATVSTMVLTVVVLIFGEVTPKSLAKEMPETVATAVAPALSLLMLVFTPLTWLFSQWKRFLGHFVHSTEEDTITEGELMTMVSEAENDGELTDRESELIRSAIEFDDVEVEEILTPPRGCDRGGGRYAAGRGGTDLCGIRLLPSASVPRHH